MLTPEMRAIYPCLCLWRGLEQITSTRPLRRMILHFSHIGLTEGRTFTLALALVWSKLGSYLSPALETARGRRYRAEDRHAARTVALRAHRGMLAMRPVSAGLSRRPAPARFVPGGQNPRPVRGDGHRELEVGGQRAVLGVDGPVIVAHPDPVAPGCDHRLDGQDHPGL